MKTKRIGVHCIALVLTAAGVGSAQTPASPEQSRETRAERDKRAAANMVVAEVDRELHLSPAQREKMSKALVSVVPYRPEWQLRATRMMDLRPSALHEMMNRRLAGSLGEFLTPAQVRLWKLLYPFPAAGLTYEDVDKETEKLEAEFETTYRKVLAELGDGKLSREQARTKVQAAQRKSDEKLSAIWPGRPDDFEAYTKLVAAAALESETSRIGELDKPAEQRLATATESVLKQLPTEWDSADEFVAHALYQKAVKESLSPEAYATYTARRAEGTSFRQRALRGLVVAFLDAQLELNDNQRKRIEAIAADLPVPDKSGINPMDVFEELASRIDPKALTPAQRKSLEKAGEAPWKLEP